MPRTLVNPQSPAPGGVQLAYTAPVIDGDAVPAGCKVLVRNGSAAEITVTVVTGGTQSGLAVADVGPVAVPAGADWSFGPFEPRETFVQPSGTEVGRVYINYSAVAGVTRAAVATS